MRCARSEQFFEGLLDGTLAGPKRVALERHLSTCERCGLTLQELRVIDALLLAPRRLEPAANFTFKTMAEIRSAPAPQQGPRLWPWFLGFYLALSWAAIGAWFAIGRPDGLASFALAIDALRHAMAALDGIARVVGTGFGLGYAGVAGLMTFLLVFDLALLCGVLMLRAVIRPRLATHLTRTEAA